MTHLTPNELTKALRALRVEPPERDFQARLSVGLRAAAQELRRGQPGAPVPTGPRSPQRVEGPRAMAWWRRKRRYVALGIAALALPAAAFAARSAGWIELPSWRDKASADTHEQVQQSSPPVPAGSVAKRQARRQPKPGKASAQSERSNETPAPSVVDDPQTQRVTTGTTREVGVRTASAPNRASSAPAPAPEPRTTPTEATEALGPGAAPSGAAASPRVPLADLPRVRVRRHAPQRAAGESRGTPQVAPILREAAEDAERARHQSATRGEHRAQEQRRREGTERRDRRQSGRQSSPRGPR